ncbi:MAG: sulfatase-like hydrolase/transferase [Planctomycetota bacterium]
MNAHLRTALCIGLICLAACGSDSDADPSGVPDPPFVPLAADGPRAETAGPRLILFLLIDALRADHLGIYGGQATPSLDRLAGGAYVFENATATSSWTRSSVASLFTSRYPTALGILSRTDSLPPGVPTLASQLAMFGGYRTVGISTNGNAGAGIGFAQGFEEFWVPEERRSYPDGFGMVPAEVVTKEALDWLDQRERGGERVFLFLHYTDPHDPYFEHEGLSPPPTASGRFDGSRSSLEAMDKEPQGSLTEDDKDRIRQLYAGEVHYVDHWIGELMKGLRVRGIPWEEMLLIVTADHGEGLWDHGERAHGTDLYQEMIRVPLFIRLPGMMKEDGRRIEEPVSLVDVAPTLLALCDIDKPRGFQGHDLSPLWRGESRSEAMRYIYSEMDYSGRDLESLRLGKHKLIRNRDLADREHPALELYDLEADPREMKNLAGRKLPIEDHLQAALFKWRRALTADAPEREGEERLELLSPETLESLRRLGYIGQQEYEEALRKQKK